MIVLEILLCALLGNAAYLASTLLAARLLGAPAEVARLGFGPRLLSLPLGPVKLELCLLPLTSFVTFTGMAPDDGPPVGFRAMHPLRRIGVVVGSWVLPMALAVVLLGPGRAGHHLATALPHLYAGFDTPAGVVLVKAFAALPFGAALGVILAQMTAFNLLPFPGMTGGNVLRYLLEWTVPAVEKGHKVWMVLQMLLIPAMLAVSIRWIYVVYRAYAG